MNCANCNKETNPDLSFCSYCKFPTHPSDKEKASFYAAEAILSADVESSLKNVLYAKILIFVLAFYHLLVGLTFPQNDSVIYFTIGGIFLLLGLTSLKWTFLSLVSALTLVSIFYIFLAFLDLSFIFQGIIWKGIILTILLYAVLRVYKSNNALKENPYLAEKFGRKKI